MCFTLLRPFLFDGGVKLSSNVHIIVSENIGNQINIICFRIKGGAVAAPQLMRCNLFLRCCHRRIFLHQIFHAAHSQAFLAKRKEKRRFILCACPCLN